MYSQSDRQLLLSLARESIGCFLATGKKFAVGENGLSRGMLETRASFVTLTKDFELRGCVGSLEARRPLYLDVIYNAYAAAFEDNRFFPLTKQEWPEIAIEISVLTKPESVIFASPQELLDKLTIGVDGVIVSRGDKGATYLPQVWDDILEKKDFLSSLCLKAGLPPDDWQKPGIKIETYQVEIISEAGQAISN